MIISASQQPVFKWVKENKDCYYKLVNKLKPKTSLAKKRKDLKAALNSSEANQIKQIQENLNSSIGDKVEQIKWNPVLALADTTRGSGGFGSTGKQ